MRIELPQDWSAVTLKQFQAIQALLQDEGTAYGKNVELISVLSGWDIKQVEGLSLRSYTSILKAVEFVNHPIENKLTRKFKLNGKKYRVTSDVYQLNGGQYITLQHLLKDPDKVIDNLHEIMAVFAVPYERKWWGWKRGKYDSDQHTATAAEMLDCPVSIVQPLSAFFLGSWEKSGERMLEYSESQTRTAELQMIRELRRFTPDTDGSLPSIPWLITMLQNGVFSSLYPSKNSLISSVSKKPSKHTTTSS